MENVRLRDKNRITLPSNLVEALHLEKDAQMEAHIEDGRIVLVPVITIARDQAWFWTEEWQKGERESDEDIAAGRISGPFSNTDDLIRSLEADEEE
jgi:antitoxin component of MazEF toxin-antitoxin module